MAAENGRRRVPLVDSIRPYEEQLRFTLGRLTGTSLWAFSLWRAPEGANLHRDIPFSEYGSGPRDRTERAGRA